MPKHLVNDLEKLPHPCWHATCVTWDVTITFNVPGDAIGGPAVDIFPVGTKFQRLDVPTWENPSRPSLDATLYAKPAGEKTYGLTPSTAVRIADGRPG